MAVSPYSMNDYIRSKGDDLIVPGENLYAWTGALDGSTNITFYTTSPTPSAGDYVYYSNYEKIQWSDNFSGIDTYGFGGSGDMTITSVSGNSITISRKGGKV